MSLAHDMRAAARKKKALLSHGAAAVLSVGCRNMGSIDTSRKVGFGADRPEVHP